MLAWNDVATVSVVLAVGAVACGGSTTSGVTSSEGGAEDGAAASSSGGAEADGSSSGDDSGADGSWIVTGGSSSGGSSSGSSGAMSSASSSGAAPPGDGGPNQIACGANGPCDSTTQVCCAMRTGRSCVALNACAAESIACSGSNSCVAGDVCCEELTATGTIRTRCAATCPTGSRQLCTTVADCKSGDACRHGLDGYSYCVARPTSDAGASDAAGD
jgi:hypothetical protein